MRKIIPIGVLLLVSALGVGYLVSRPGKKPSQKPERKITLSDAQRAFDNGDYQKSFSIAAQLVGANKKSPRAAMIAGESATKLNQFGDAVKFYGKVANDAREAPVARWAEAEVLYHLGRTSEARRSLLTSLKLDPGLMAAHDRMVDLCSNVGLRRDSLPNLMAIVRSGQVKPDYLMLMGNLEKETWIEPKLRDYLSKAPNDLLPNLGLARIAMVKGEYQKAKDLLKSLVAFDSELAEAHVQLGEVLLKLEPGGLGEWNKALPKSAELHPGTWNVRGQWCRGEGNSEGALRCFSEAIKLDANHLPAHQATAQLLNAAGNGDLASKFADRSEKIQKVNIALEQLYFEQQDTKLMKGVAELCKELGRVWECIGWCSIAKSFSADDPWPDQLAASAMQVGNITANTPHTMPEFNLGNSSYFARFSVPDFGKMASKLVEPSSGDIGLHVADIKSQFRLEDVTEEHGLAFTFDSNTAANHDARRMQEFTGGGIGVIDFDLDGWQDLFFSQGGRFPVEGDGNDNSHLDRLFRCLANDEKVSFVDVSAFTRMVDFAFGQGVSIGDVNADGLDDIYVCNVGQNQLWLNAGDGTFFDGGVLLPQDTTWTASAAIADLNFDGIPEIYDANYVQGEDVYTKVCEFEGKGSSCSPLEFEPTSDRVLVSDAEGRFRAASGAKEMQGNSLGVVVFKMLGDELPSVFVAVDQAANLLGKVLPVEPADDRDQEREFEFANDALVSGIAYDSAGEAQACMGVAAGDANNDGEVDFFVSNFYNEYYTLYMQEVGLFSDATASTGTIGATRPLLGFGTQFFDANLDGNQDLFVINGHIEDHTHAGIPEKMPSLLFAGNGNGKFELVPPEDSFLELKLLGRSLAKVDFDRDGQMDFVFGDLEESSRLLRNSSQAVGISIGLRLVGTQSARNAICTVATLVGESENGEDYTQTLQLTGGSGYQASNERVLQFCVPAKVAESIAEYRIEIQWPSGLQETVDGVQASTECIAVEGQGLHVLRRY